MSTEILIYCNHGGFSFSEKAKQFIKQRNIEFDAYDDPIIHRHNLILIECFKTLKEDFVEDKFSYNYLKIVTIEEDRYIITEYDGWESVITPNSLESKWIYI